MTFLAPGTELGPFEILAPIGHGGMGEVYRARDSRLEREVAIKIVPERFAGDKALLARFMVEAKAVAALSHPNILALFDVGTQRGISYAVTELLEGGTLRQVLIDGPLPTQKVIDCALQMAAGLAAAHDKGIIHRDFKPDNVFLTRDGQIKILDFGLAKVHEDALAGSEQPTQARHTLPGAIVGTAGYMAPEQVRGRDVDVRSDIFSFGATLYELLTGRPAFCGDSPVESMTAVLQEEVPRVTELAPDVSPHLAEIVGRCLEKNPGDRFQTVRDLAFSLGSVSSIRGGASSDFYSTPSVSYQESPSIAVLPFTDMSPRGDQEYFCDGMAEEVLNALTHCGELRVVARTSAFKFKGVVADIRRIGQDLQVKTVLEGSVRTAGKRLRATATLINVADGYQLWSESYDRVLDDVFAIQDDIAQKIVSSLKIELLDEPEKPAERRTDLKAYLAYLKARFHMNKRTTVALKKGASLARDAISVDDGYAPAHACLADCLFLLGFQGVLDPREAMPAAKAAAERALELDDALGEAHTSLGCILSTYDWNGVESEREFQRAVELNPGYATAHYWYAVWRLIPTGRFNKAKEAIQRARELDPLSLVVNAGMGWQFYFARDFERAMQELEKTLEIDENFVMAYDVASQALGQLRRYDDAVAAAQKSVSLSRRRSLSVGILGYAHSLSGDKDAARTALDELLALRRKQYVSAYDIAIVYAGLDEKENALHWLETACEERNGWLVFLKVEPRFDSLRPEERFTAIIERLESSQ